MVSLFCNRASGGKRGVLFIRFVPDSEMAELLLNPPVLTFANHSSINGVAFDRNAARFHNQAFDVIYSQFLMSCARAFPFGDVIPNHRAVKIIYPPIQAD